MGMLEVIRGVLSDEERHDQMQTAVDLRLPFLEKATKPRKDAVCIVGYGPSLLQTWPKVKLFQKFFRRPVITVSGAHDFLISRGVIPDYHVEIDPRPHKPKMLTQPQETTKYLMASVCHPDFWDVLRGHDVHLWHMVNDQQTVDWVAAHHPAGMACLIGGGSTAGQRAMNVGRALGFSEFHVFGVDLSFEGPRHADTHTGEPQLETVANVLGNRFRTTPQLLQAAREMEEFLKNTTDMKATFYGTGLMQEVAKRIKEST